jgi:hypothetical protein
MNDKQILERLENDGFYFGNCEIKNHLKKRLYNLPFRSFKSKKYSSLQYELDSKHIYFHWVKNAICNELPVGFKKMLQAVDSVGLHIMKRGDYYPLHTDSIEPCYAQLLLWITKDDCYEGREFIYGKDGDLKEFKPKSGDFCIANNINPNFIHGVSELKSDTEIITFTYQLLPRG